MRRTALIVQWLFVLLFTLLCQPVLGFMSSPCSATTRTPQMSVATKATAEDFTIPDKEGNAIGKGSVVKVIAPDLKAYQVSPKGFGSFAESGEFVPAEPSSDRGTKSLKLPIGLTGVVTKVYDESKISSNLPIQVKFVPGAYPDAEFDPPVPFLMHFKADEVEWVA